MGIRVAAGAYHIKMNTYDARSVCWPTPRSGVQAIGIKEREAKSRATWFGPRVAVFTALSNALGM
jgi:hypothetical protein